MRPITLMMVLVLVSLLTALAICVFRLSELNVFVAYGIVVAFALENIGWYVDVDSLERGSRIVRRFCQLTFVAVLPFVFWNKTMHLDPPTWEVYGIIGVGTLVSVLLWFTYVRFIGIAVWEFYTTMHWPIR